MMLLEMIFQSTLSSECSLQCMKDTKWGRNAGLEMTVIHKEQLSHLGTRSRETIYVFVN